jgi:16S rRNA (uracil1498-N3)-methyltransferase
MELFCAYKVEGGTAYLDAEESGHCVRVLRHREGDTIYVLDGSAAARPGLLICRITDDSPKSVTALVESHEPGWGGHPYHLRMAVCPTKNIDRYEWFVEKAVELGVDEIVPVIGEHSERRVVRPDRLRKIALSAAKQSLKGAVPAISDAVTVLDFLASQSAKNGIPGADMDNSDYAEALPSTANEIRLIAYCSDDVAARGSIVEVLARGTEAGKGSAAGIPASAANRAITVLIGPEGDFSKEEVAAAIDAGFIPVHLGPSRLRTETAAITAVEAVYLTLSSGAYDSAPGSQLADNQPLPKNKSAK